MTFLVQLFQVSILALPVLGYLLLKKYPWLKHDWKELKFMVKAILRIKSYEKKRFAIFDVFEEKARIYPKKTFLIFQDNNYSYEYMDQQMNRVANAFSKLGLKQGDVVAMLMANEPAFIWTYFGLGKIGVQPAFLNFNLRNKSLLHCFKVSGTKTLVLGQGDDLLQAIKDILPDLEALGVNIYIYGAEDSEMPKGFISLDKFLAETSSSRPRRELRNTVTMRTPMCYIYTSGTTGLPKAAVVSVDKAFKGGMLMNSVNVNENDVFYTPLPLYHSAAGLIALGTTVLQGATLVLRNKFSATHFIEDCRKHNVTVIQYIGELCRYLCARPKSPDDKNHKIRIAFGNGLRRDIWREFRDRFNIPVIGEFYAATEGNGGFINHYNKFGSIGRTSPIMNKIVPTSFIKYDVIADEPVRNDKGFCVPVGPNQPGLLVVKIRTNFNYDGYKGNRDLSEKKIIKNVFKKGDEYFNSGDLLEYDEEQFVYFVDRIGDTFRWKGENVSTIEVSNVVADLSWINDANVFGVEVPGQDGRAGMVALSLTRSQSLLTPAELDQLYKHCTALLPTYACPHFVRVQHNLDMTSTFKLQKMQLIKDGFNPNSCGNDPLYCMDSSKKSYVSIDTQVYENIISGKMRI